MEKGVSCKPLELNLICIKHFLNWSDFGAYFSVIQIILIPRFRVEIKEDFEGMTAICIPSTSVFLPINTTRLFQILLKFSTFLRHKISKGCFIIPLIDVNPPKEKKVIYHQLLIHNPKLHYKSNKVLKVEL